MQPVLILARHILTFGHAPFVVGSVSDERWCKVPFPSPFLTLNPCAHDSRGNIVRLDVILSAVTNVDF